MTHLNIIDEDSIYVEFLSGDNGLSLDCIGPHLTFSLDFNKQNLKDRIALFCEIGQALQRNDCRELVASLDDIFPKIYHQTKWEQ